MLRKMRRVVGMDEGLPLRLFGGHFGAVAQKLAQPPVLIDAALELHVIDVDDGRCGFEHRARKPEIAGMKNTVVFCIGLSHGLFA